MKKVILLLFLYFIPLFSFAQFSGDEVLVYVKAGDNPSTSKSVVVIGYYSRRNEIRQMTSDASRIRKTISNSPEFFDSPYNIPEKSNILSGSYRSPSPFRSYDSKVSTSKYTVFSAHSDGGYDPVWGVFNDAITSYFAFSKDKEELLIWEAGKENNRQTYILTDLSLFDPASSAAHSYDFLE